MTQTLDTPTTTIPIAGNGQNLPAQIAPPQQAQAFRREIRVVEDDSALANLMDTARFEHLQRISTLMSSSALLPDHLVGKKTREGWIDYPLEAIRANCFRIVNQALRWGMDPFAIIDETYVVGGKLGYQGKLVAAVVNARAGLKRRLLYEFTGTGADLTVTVIGTFDGEDEPRTVQLKLSDARTDNQMWQKDPQQKLIYSGVVKWARRHCPEVVLGVLTDEDIERIEASRAASSTVRTEVRQVMKDMAAPAAPAPTNGAPGSVADPFGKPVPRAQMPASDDEAERVIQEAAAKARAAEAARTSSTPSTVDPAAPTGNEPAAPAAVEQGKPVWPATLPDHARTSEDWINDVILHFKPQGWSGTRAKKSFHATDVRSWNDLPLEIQDRKYEELVRGSFRWK